VRTGQKSLIKLDLRLQNIHKFRFMGKDSGWVVKAAMMLIRLSGSF
jgi:hypothetical protein